MLTTGTQAELMKNTGGCSRKHRRDLPRRQPDDQV